VKKATPKKKAKAKPKPKAKPKAKVKPKPKPKPKPKKQISITAQKRLDAQKTKELKEKALLKPPKKLPETTWSLVFAESSVKGSPITGDSAKSASYRYKNLSPEENEVRYHCPNLKSSITNNVSATITPRPKTKKKIS